MKLIAKKPCSFGGEQFYIGDEIPAEIVLDPKAQEKMGVLVCVDAEGQPQPMDENGKIPCEWNFSLSVPQESGESMVLDFDLEGMTSALFVLISSPDDAKKIIEEMTNSDALSYIYMADTRKSIKAAAEARAKAIEEAGEQ